jgi:hypothetical protein
MALALALASPGGTAGSALPAGTYRYVYYDGTRRVVTTTVVIERNDGTLTVKESSDAQGTSIDTSRKLDPATFTTLAYAVTTPGANETVGVSGTSATYRHLSKTTVLHAPAAGPSIVFAFFLGGFATLPAMIHTATVKTFNVYCICPYSGFDAKPSKIVPATEPRPAGVSPADAEAAFSIDGGVATIWYDPLTFVLHRLDLPGSKIRIVIQP